MKMGKIFTIITLFSVLVVTLAFSTPSSIAEEASIEKEYTKVPSYQVLNENPEINQSDKIKIESFLGDKILFIDLADTYDNLKVYKVKTKKFVKNVSVFPDGRVAYFEESHIPDIEITKITSELKEKLVFLNDQDYVAIWVRVRDLDDNIIAAKLHEKRSDLFDEKGQIKDRSNKKYIVARREIIKDLYHK